MHSPDLELTVAFSICNVPEPFRVSVESKNVGRNDLPVSMVSLTVQCDLEYLFLW